jgi:hypothetical protein
MSGSSFRRADSWLYITEYILYSAVIENTKDANEAILKRARILPQQLPNSLSSKNRSATNLKPPLLAKTQVGVVS